MVVVSDMAKQRMINTKFWSDPWVMTKLNSLDRLLFLYLISNELTNISGIYEISEHRIAFDTGIEKDTLVKAMMPRLEPKIYYKDNWVIIVNFTKHQNLKSQDVILGIKREFALAPIAVQKEALARGWGEGLGMMPDTKPNLTKLIARVSENAAVPSLSETPIEEIRIVNESDVEPKIGRVLKKEQLIYEPLIQWSEKERGFKFLATERGKQYKSLKLANQNGLNITELKDRWDDFSTDKFWSKKGFDWMNVVLDFNKRR